MYVCSFLVLMPPVRIYNENSQENKEKTAVPPVTTWSLFHNQDNSHRFLC